METPVQAINGLSEDDTRYLKEAFAITTIERLANNKFFKAAKAISFFLNRKEILNKNKSFRSTEGIIKRMIPFL